MVRVCSLLLGAALGVAALASPAFAAAESAYDALPSFAIPAFDYATLTQGEAPERLLAELQANGIVALRNVPNYANARARFLQSAAECAVAAEHDGDARFLSRKTFADGTRRLTISTNAGAELSAATAAETQDKCPGYQAVYRELSEIVERAVHTFGSTLDATSFTASDGAGAVISSRKLVGEAVRLDHFHAYEAAPTAGDGAEAAAPAARELSLSLPLHEDHGLFIAMSAPTFFDVREDGARRSLVERALAADRSGLVIQTAAGARVRPVLNADEVVIMMGTGASRWLRTSHALPAVLHGMKMPELSSDAAPGARSLRAWFGKMTLLPAYQRMLLDAHTTFDAHVNATTRFLLQKGADASELKTIGCAGERRLEASEGSCTRRECSTKAGATAPAEGCNTVCNRLNHSEDDAPDCAAKCTCTDVASSAERCWMLCVANLPLDKCAKADQTCKGQEITCLKPAPAPAPTTASPTPGGAATTSKPSTASSGSGASGRNSSAAGNSSSATVTTPAPTTAAPKSAAVASAPSVALLASATAAVVVMLQ